MKTGSEDTPLPLPPALLAEAQAAAEEEHRPTLDLVREAVQRYLQQRHHARLTSADAAEKARAFEIWARNHPYTPPLSDDAIRRENLVRDA